MTDDTHGECSPSFVQCHGFHLIGVVGNTFSQLHDDLPRTPPECWVRSSFVLADHFPLLHLNQGWDCHELNNAHFVKLAWLKSLFLHRLKLWVMSASSNVVGLNRLHLNEDHDCVKLSELLSRDFMFIQHFLQQIVVLNISAILNPDTRCSILIFSNPVSFSEMKFCVIQLGSVKYMKTSTNDSAFNHETSAECLINPWVSHRIRWADGH
jgi:hypothetical protein